MIPSERLLCCLLSLDGKFDLVAYSFKPIWQQNGFVTLLAHDAERTSLAFQTTSVEDVCIVDKVRTARGQPKSGPACRLKKSDGIYEDILRVGNRDDTSRHNGSLRQPPISNIRCRIARERENKLCENDIYSPRSTLLHEICKSHLGVLGVLGVPTYSHIIFTSSAIFIQRRGSCDPSELHPTFSSSQWYFCFLMQRRPLPLPGRFKGLNEVFGKPH